MVTKAAGIELPPLKLAAADISIIGDTPLIVHAWSQKAREEMLRKQMKLPQHREPKDPIQAFLRSMYRTDSNHFGIPAVGIKNAMVTACTSVEGITKTAARQAFIVVGERGKTRAAFAEIFSPQDLVRILSPNPPTMREDMVRLQGIGNTADLRYRAEYWPWACRLTIRYNQNVLSLEQLANLLNTSGFGVGLCEWRPERDGQSGTFHVADELEARMIEGKEWQKHHEPELPDVKAWLRRINETGIAVEELPEAAESPPRRRPGRPRKHPLPAPPAATEARDDDEASGELPDFSQLPDPDPRRRGPRRRAITVEGP